MTAARQTPQRARRPNWAWLLTVLLLQGCSAPPPAPPAASGDKLQWQAVRAADTAVAYRSFMQTHPTSARAALAERALARIEADRAYAELGGSDATYDALEAFLQRHATATQASAAYARIRQRWERDRLAAVDAELDGAIRAGTAKALEDFIERHPHSSRLPDARKALLRWASNPAFEALRERFARDVQREVAQRARRGSEPEPAAPLLVFFHARTDEAMSHLVFMDESHAYLRIPAGKAAEKLPDRYELLELRGISPYATFVLYLSSADMADEKAFERSANQLITAFLRIRCEVLGPKPCSQARSFLMPDTFASERKEKWIASWSRTLQEATVRRPRFGTPARYTDAALPTWSGSEFHRAYVDFMCRHVMGPRTQERQAAVGILASIDEPEGNRCLFAGGAAADRALR